MGDKHTVTVGNEADVVMMRVLVRDLARDLGMNMIEQASVSLAASSLAYALGFADKQASHVTIECLKHDGRTGLQITLTKPDCVPEDVSSAKLSDAKWMVDDLLVETPSTQDLQITLVKWMTRSV